MKIIILILTGVIGFLPAGSHLTTMSMPQRQRFSGLYTERRLKRWRGKESWQCEIYFLHRFQGRRWDKYMLWECNGGEAVWVMLSEINNTGAGDLKVAKWILPTILYTRIKIISLMFLLIHPIWLNNLLFVITGEEVILKKPAMGFKELCCFHFVFISNWG